ncbi:MAG: acetyl-CoA C-acetyltransferase [Magnetococcales bacterium]|nr:acetyl-CoA C-acetyltransferase [Magnetococcales bacterium]
MEEVVVVAAGRTAIGNFMGSLSSVPAHELGTAVIKGLLQRSGLKPDQIDEVIMGQILTADCGPNTARQAAIAAGIPVDVPAFTVNRLCASGMTAVHLATQAIRLGDAHTIIAGGQESMTRAPHTLGNNREGVKMGEWTMKDSLFRDALTDVFGNYPMGNTAENVAKQWKISRDDQDKLALRSQQRAEAAQKAGRFKDEIIPVVIPQKKKDPIVFEQDEFLKIGTTPESLAKLRPAFDKNGSVTAGNSSGINDGASGMILMSQSKAKELGLKPLARIVAYAVAGLDPSIMGAGPIFATRKVLQKAGWKVEDLQLIEANEAFAAQACAVNNDLGLNPDIVNVNGGGIALGHPVGSSGARIIVTLIYEMQRRKLKKGLATLCVGGGMGAATLIEVL